MQSEGELITTKCQDEAPDTARAVNCGIGGQPLGRLTYARVPDRLLSMAVCLVRLGGPHIRDLH